jgi:uncharacterized membrane protein
VAAPRSEKLDQYQWELFNGLRKGFVCENQYVRFSGVLSFSVMMMVMIVMFLVALVAVIVTMVVIMVVIMIMVTMGLN